MITKKVNMKIWIDIRNLSLDQKKFSCEFIKYFHSQNKNAFLNIYSNNEIEWITTIASKKFHNIFWEQILFLQQLLQDQNDLVITFNDSFPLLYNKRFISVITSLEKLLYPNVDNSKTFIKYSYQWILKYNLKKAEKIICFDEQIKKDINEKLNIEESKIEILPAFFYSQEESVSQIDIKLKHSFTWDYLIYDSEIWTNKNIKRLIESISKININIIFIGNKISSDLETRELIIKLWLKNKVIFAYPEEKELWLYYKQSLWVIFPLLYSSFPLWLSTSIYYKTQILSSNIDELYNIFGDKIEYFSPISTIEMTQSIENLIKNGKKEVNYDTIIQKYSVENFSNNLSKICQI